MTPRISNHSHIRGLCPVAVKSNEWCPAQKGDSRSPCPALNTLANHGYLPRNGKDIGMFDIVNALKAGYHLSTFFAWFLTLGSFFLVQQWGRISLGDLARHNRIEHDASLAHRNAEFEAEYAPCEVDDTLLESLCIDATTIGKDGLRMNAENIARARIRRENESPVLNAVHAEIARGEMAIALRIFGGKNGSRDGVPIEWMKEWIKYERLPKGWSCTHTVGLFDAINTSADIRHAMQTLAEEDVENVEDDDIGKALSDSISSSEDSLFTSGDAPDTTPPTSDSEDGMPEKNPDDEERHKD